MKRTFKKLLMHVSSVALSLFMGANFALGVFLSEYKIQKKYITVAAEQPAVTLNTPVNANYLTAKAESNT